MEGLERRGMDLWGCFWYWAGTDFEYDHFDGI